MPANPYHSKSASCPCCSHRAKILDTIEVEDRRFAFSNDCCQIALLGSNIIALAIAEHSFIVP